MTGPTPATTRARRIAAAAATCALVALGLILAVLGDRFGGGDPGQARFRPDDTTLATCRNVDDARQADCLGQAYGNLAHGDGPRAALERLALAASEAGPEARHCHRITHAVGAAALERSAGDVSRALADGDSTCSMGYYHGVVEQAFDELPAPEQLQATCDEAELAVVADACAHGAGHGFMLLTSGDVDRSIDACSPFTGFRERRCVGGVYMEAFATLRPDPVAAGLDGGATCRAAPDAFRGTCIRAVGGGAVSGAPSRAWPERARRCDEFGDEAGACWGAVGETAAEDSAGDVDAILATCGVGGVHEVTCISGAASFERLISARGSDELCARVRPGIADPCRAAGGGAAPA